MADVSRYLPSHSRLLNLLPHRRYLCWWNLTAHSRAEIELLQDRQCPPEFKDGVILRTDPRTRKAIGWMDIHGKVEAELGQEASRRGSKRIPTDLFKQLQGIIVSTLVTHIVLTMLFLSLCIHT